MKKNKGHFDFTFTKIEKQYKKALDLGYNFITCKKFADNQNKLKKHTIVNRIDIDLSVKKAARLGNIFNRLGIKGTFFIRLHEPKYNPFSFENYRIIKSLIKDGHEIGYHSEIIVQGKLWNEDPQFCLLRDIDVINRMFNIKVSGVASHRSGLTLLNNLDFWKGKKASKYGLYEAYEESNEFNLWGKSFYISDSEWTQWKCYNKGKLVKGDQRSFGEHLDDMHNLIYLLIHSDTYYDKHFYEGEYWGGYAF